MTATSLTGHVVGVTGADGFIGRHVCEMAESAGAEVRRIVAPPGSRQGAFIADLVDPAAAREAVEGCDLVIHLAAHAGGVQFQDKTALRVLDENNAMTSNVLRGCADAAVRRCFLASSGVVYSESAVGMLSETAPTVAPGREHITPYAWSKLTSEVVGSWFNGETIEVVVGRFTNVYGAGASFDPRASTVIHSLIRKAVDAGAGGNLEVWGDGSAVRSFVHVRDCARAVVRILARGMAGEVYNVSSTGPVAIRDLAEAIRDVVDPSLAIRYDVTKPTGPAKRVLDDRKLRSLGCEPLETLESGLAEVVEAYRASLLTDSS